jgi:hypothetical protein
MSSFGGGGPSRIIYGRGRRWIENSKSTPPHPAKLSTPQEGNNLMHEKIPLLRGVFLLYFCMGGRRGGVFLQLALCPSPFNPTWDERGELFFSKSTPALQASPS